MSASGPTLASLTAIGFTSASVALISQGRSRSAAAQ
jgi:hypothetical protein